jgi:hypothetical protein
MRILCYILVVLFVTTTAVGQQINPVPDYIFRNSMSVGRNAPTDTSAYFSIGPRFGATRGFMPPMVVDTAAVTGTKRNGLLIYSIQRNSFLYWDSTGSRWSRIAANLDTLLLSTRAWRQKGDDSLAARINTLTDTTNRLSTKAWRQKGIDSLASVRIGGSGTEGVFPIFTGATTLGNTTLRSNGDNTYTIARTSGAANNFVLKDSLGSASNPHSKLSFINNLGLEAWIGSSGSAAGDFGGMTLEVSNRPIRLRTNGNTRLLATSAGRVLIGTETESTYTLDVAGSFRSTSALVTGTSEVNGAALSVTGTNTSFSISPAYAGSGELPAGTLIASGGTNANYAFIPEAGAGTAGRKVVFAGYNGSSWKSVAEYENVSSGNEPRLALVRNAGNVVVGGSGSGSYKMDITGTLRSTADAYFNTSSGETYIGTTSDAGAFKLQVNGVARASDGLATGNPNGGTAATWKLGIVVAGSYTAASNYLQVDVGGTLYYIGLVTPN